LAVAYDRDAHWSVSTSPRNVADRSALASRFPQLGFYSVSNSLEVPGVPLVGDAIDDLLDIASDLATVLSELKEAGQN
jgi:hypothetical protein